MNRKLLFLLGLLAGTGGMLPAQAQSLSDALVQAWARHPTAATMPAREDEVAARREASASLLPGAPSVSLSNLNDRYHRDVGRNEWEVEMAVPLWLPGQWSAREAEAESAGSEFAARRLALRLQVAGEVREAWWAVASARAAEQLAKQRLASAQQLERDVQRRFKLGDLSRVDANLARSELLASEAEMLEAQAGLLAAEQSYAQLTGVAPPALLQAEAPADTIPAPETHPGLLAVAANAQLARSRLKVADESRRDSPELAFRVMRERGSVDESYSNAVGFKITIPFSSGPRVRHENAAARAELSQADAELAQAKLKMQQQLDKAGRELASAERQLVMASERKALAADNLRLAEKSFALGESDLASLLRIRTAAFEAEALYRRQTIGQSAAQSRLKQAMGVLP
ncbi:MAG: TolC family protein [Zoogloeaceae bacterium]|nr:TolC family protein [Zoogloeaceae bacterium]